LKTVCLILKCPRIGQVKTRLANAIGAESATLIYRALVEHQCAELPSQWEVSVWFTPADAEEEMRNWLEPHLSSGARFLPQVDGDLGQRLTMVVQTEFARERERIFLIGGDCPGLSQGYFLQADYALDSNDVFIGPAHDGGYVLLGLKRPVAIGTSNEPALSLPKGPALSLPKGLEAWETKQKERSVPQRTIEMFDPDLSHAASRVQTPVDRPVRDASFFLNANPALRTGLFSLGPFGTSSLCIFQALCGGRARPRSAAHRR
jgi:rSAM/selenodomain-associated transferase 1